MNDKYFTVTAITCLLGIYSARIYHFSLDDIHNGSYEEESTTIPDPSQDIDDVEKIMRAVRMQGPSQAQTNLPLPGVRCAITLNELLEEDTANPLDEETLQCLIALDAGLER